MKYTPERVTKLKDNQVFVFGSNTAGKHGRGAALTALQKFGAIYGQGIGLQGQSYGVPTKDKKLHILSLSTIDKYVRRFLKFATEHPELEFLVTKIGCGLAGYKYADIGPLFFDEYNPSSNIILPKEFYEVVGLINTKEK
jgi:hypothetical protein